MGDRNQIDFVRSLSHLVKGRILDVGSRDYGNTPNYRDLFPGQDYVGVDMSPGANVDVCVDLAADYEAVAAAVGGKVSTVICCSVLEHVLHLQAFCANLARLLHEGGHLIVSVPFAWRIHGYPDDYWRFTPSGVKALFPSISFLDEHASYSWGSHGKVRPVSQHQHFHISRSNFREYGLVRGGLALVLGRLKLLPDHWLEGYTLPPSMINMVGRKTRED